MLVVFSQNENDLPEHFALQNGAVSQDLKIRTRVVPERLCNVLRTTFLDQIGRNEEFFPRPLQAGCFISQVSVWICTITLVFTCTFILSRHQIALAG